MRPRIPSFVLGVVAGVLGSLLIALSLSSSRASAQTSGGVFGSWTLYPSPRKDTDKNESFMFVNQETGDIWIYMDANPHEHYRFTKIGEPLEKVKN